MPTYKIDIKSGDTERQKKYDFRSEGTEPVSPQALIANHPEIILDVPELEIQNDANVIVAREYSTKSGSIDILIITSNADIVIVETKLLRNPESHRAVVAQVIDYVKAFCNESTKEIILKLSKSSYIKNTDFNSLKNDDFWISSLGKNIQTGNYKVVILGDKIHPNVLGMVESIQSAPHLSFTIYCIELNPVEIDNKSIIISPQIVTNTVEIERSVIRIEIDHKERKHIIESGIPEKDGKGTRPKLTPAQYLDIITQKEFKSTIEKFWDRWREIGGDINMGVAGFSAGIPVGDTRMPLQFCYLDRVPIMSERWRSNINLPDDLYQEYKESLKRSHIVYDGYCVGNKVLVPFEEISENDLEVIFDSVINLAKKILSKDRDS